MNKILLEIIGLSYSHSQSGAYALVLGNKGDKKCLPIIIGEHEAQSIAIAMEDFENKRPLTHDLFKSFATSFDISVTEVVITRFKDGLFFSELHCVKGGEEHIIDSRTSDAIAIALRFKSPIYAYAQVMEEAGIVIDEDELNAANEEVATDEYDYYSISDLENLLNEAIENEDYTTASKLRDIINDRKQKEI